MKIDLYGHETADFYGLYEQIISKIYRNHISFCKDNSFRR